MNLCTEVGEKKIVCKISASVLARAAPLAPATSVSMCTTRRAHYVRRPNNNVIIMQNDVATSSWRNNDVIIASCLRWNVITLLPGMFVSSDFFIVINWPHCIEFVYVRQNDIATSFWRINDVIIAPCFRWAVIGL